MVLTLVVITLNGGKVVMPLLSLCFVDSSIQILYAVIESSDKAT